MINNIKLLRTGIGIVVVYTAYSTYVQMRTSYEISERARKKLYESDLENVDRADWPTNKFSSMIVGGRFVNPFTHYRPQTVFEFVYCRIAELFHAKPRGGVPNDPQVISKQLPTRTPDWDLIFGRSVTGVPASSSRMTVTWLGQSCAFIQMPGFNIMTDPCLGEHLVSEYIGPKRICPSPCQIEDLPKIDLVLVSHDHPDHLELDTAEKIGNDALWVVPHGVAKHLNERGITNVTEMDWWEKVRLPVGLEEEHEQPWEVACTPAMHWSGRKMIDSNSTLWASFLLMRSGQPVLYHAGDTGYSPDLFNGIRQVFGPVKLALLPCGAYTPRWHLRPQHIDPYEAVQVMKDLGASKMVGVHWGTFVLSDEHYLEPRDKLHELAMAANRPNDIIAPEFGRTLVFDIDSENRHQKEVVRGGNALLMD